MEKIIPSSDLRNHYNEVSKRCKETREPIIITVNGRGDSVIQSFDNYQLMIAELEMLRVLARSDLDIELNRVKDSKESFSKLREGLMK